MLEQPVEVFFELRRWCVFGPNRTDVSRGCERVYRWEPLATQSLYQQPRCAFGCKQWPESTARRIALLSARHGGRSPVHRFIEDSEPNISTNTWYHTAMLWTDGPLHKLTRSGVGVWFESVYWKINLMTWLPYLVMLISSWHSQSAQRSACIECIHRTNCPGHFSGRSDHRGAISSFFQQWIKNCRTEIRKQCLTMLNVVAVQIY